MIQRLCAVSLLALTVGCGTEKSPASADKQIVGDGFPIPAGVLLDSKVTDTPKWYMLTGKVPNSNDAEGFTKGAAGLLPEHGWTVTVPPKEFMLGGYMFLFERDKYKGSFKFYKNENKNGLGFQLEIKPGWSKPSETEASK